MTHISFTQCVISGALLLLRKNVDNLTKGVLINHIRKENHKKPLHFTIDRSILPARLTINQQQKKYIITGDN